MLCARARERGLVINSNIAHLLASTPHKHTQARTTRYGHETTQNMLMCTNTFERVRNGRRAFRARALCVLSL